jgi:hypothetical protein
MTAMVDMQFTSFMDILVKVITLLAQRSHLPWQLTA